jgi:hypothetical protein
VPNGAQKVKYSWGMVWLVDPLCFCVPHVVLRCDIAAGACRLDGPSALPGNAQEKAFTTGSYEVKRASTTSYRAIFTCINLSIGSH